MLDYQPTTVSKVMYQPCYPSLPHFFKPVNRYSPDIQDVQTSHELPALQGWFYYCLPNPRVN